MMVHRMILAYLVGLFRTGAADGEGMAEVRKTIRAMGKNW